MTARAVCHSESGREDSVGTDCAMTWGFYTGVCALRHHTVTGDFVGITTRPAHVRDGDIQCWSTALWRSSRIHRTLVTFVTLDLDRFVNNIWEKWIFCLYRKSFRSLGSAHEKWEEKQTVAFIFLFSVWYLTMKKKFTWENLSLPFN